MNRPLVAVITRTRGRPHLLSRALRSVASQGFDDLVHVVVNDGGERAPVEALIREHAPAARLVHLERQIGRGAAANEGLKRSESTLVVFHDDDDTWEPGFLRQAIEAWRSSGRRGVVVGANHVRERETDGGFVEVGREPFCPRITAVSLAELTRDNCLVNLGFVFERAVTDELGGYDEELPLYEDWDFNLRFFSKFDVAYVPARLANYHQRVGAAGESRNSFEQEGARAAEARALLLNRWLRRPGPVGTLMALGPTVIAVASMRERLDKLFNLVHGARHTWPMRALESWLLEKTR